MEEPPTSLVVELSKLAEELPTGSIFEFDLEVDHVWLERLYIPPAKRGFGTHFLAKVFCACDRRGLATHFVADVTDEPDDPTTLDLVNWYRRFGAIPCERPDGWPDGWIEMKRPPGNRMGDVRELLSRYEEAKEGRLTPEDLDAIRFPSARPRS